jgi:hypothetical protein
MEGSAGRSMRSARRAPLASDGPKTSTVRGACGPQAASHGLDAGAYRRGRWRDTGVVSTASAPSVTFTQRALRASPVPGWAVARLIPRRAGGVWNETQITWDVWPQLTCASCHGHFTLSERNTRGLASRRESRHPDLPGVSSAKCGRPPRAGALRVVGRRCHPTGSTHSSVPARELAVMQLPLADF